MPMFPSIVITQRGPRARVLASVMSLSRLEGPNSNRTIHWLFRPLDSTTRHISRFDTDIFSLVMACIWMPLTSTYADREQVGESAS